MRKPKEELKKQMSRRKNQAVRGDEEGAMERYGETRKRNGGTRSRKKEEK